MKIPFIEPAPADIGNFIFFVKESIKANQYTNFGPNEKKLTSIIGKLCDADVVLVANATLALDGLHTCLISMGLNPRLPKWTFPATNLAVPEKLRIFGRTSLNDGSLGFSFFDDSSLKNYAVTTSPFGTNVPKDYIRPNVKYWIVDNAAGASPDMHHVKSWLDLGADAVIVSLHATKGLSACEGGFVAFGKKSKELFDMYSKYINFGFQVGVDGKRTLLGIGSNHKMSELSAAWCLAKLEDFSGEYERRIEISQKYLDLSLKFKLTHIYSAQAFWIRLKSNFEFSKVAHSFGFDVRPYYFPLLNGASEDENADALAAEGVCLPTRPMSKEHQLLCSDLLEKSLTTYLGALR